ncbi:MAG: TPR repeat-containing protein [Nitrosopumilales archaeon]|nr:MAG: TPR repeat-containing protein [Nitrosopumilales archaeon]
MQESAEELYEMGQRCINLGNPKEALSYFTKVLNLEPTHKKALVKKGNVLGKIGKYSQAILLYDKALKKDSKDLLALLNKGLALHYLERYDEAINCYNMALLIKPNNVTALYNIASSLILKNNVKEGLEILQKVVRLDFSYKAKAKFDIDFEQIRHLTEFKKMI